MMGLNSQPVHALIRQELPCSSQHKRCSQPKLWPELARSLAVTAKARAAAYRQTQSSVTHITCTSDCPNHSIHHGPGSLIQ